MSDSLDRIFVRIDAALSQDPNARLRECSQNLGIDRQTVTQAVKETTGVSFREYQRQKILIEALRLLAEEGDLSEREIACRLGYKTAGAFERFIEVETGSKPSDFRTLRVRTGKGQGQTENGISRPAFADPLPSLNFEK